MRADSRKAIINRRVKEKVRSALKAFTTTPTEEGLSKAYSVIDTAVKKNIFHKNKAGRKKSSLATLLKKTTPAKTSPKTKKNSTKAKSSN